MRDNDTAEATRKPEENQPDLDSPTEDLVYAQDVDWDQEAMLSSLINEDMVKEIASQLARATAHDSSPDEDQVLSDTNVMDEAGDDGPEAVDTAAEDTQELEPAESEDPDDHEAPEDEDYEEEDEDEYYSEDASDEPYGDRQRDGRYDRETLDDIIDDILDDEVRHSLPEAVAFAESPLAAGKDLRVLDRYGPPTAGVGLVVLGVTVVVAFGIGMIVERQASYFFSPVEMTVALTVLLGSFAYIFCRSWFKQAWEHRNHVIDAATATVLELDASRKTCSDDTRQLFDESMAELSSRLRSELDERSEKLRADTYRDVQKMRGFFESLLEKHVKRLNEDLREKTSLIEKLRMKQEDGEKVDAEVMRLTKENERLKKQFEDLEIELDQVDKDRRLKEDEIEELHLQLSAGGRRRGAGEAQETRMESDSDSETLRSELADLKSDLESKNEECRRLTEEMEDLVRGADDSGQAGLGLFDKVSGQLQRNLQLASRLAEQLGSGGGAGGVTDSESSVTTEIRGHLENLERLISQIVDLGKLQSSSPRAAGSEVKVKDLLNECVERVRPAAEQSGIKVAVRTSNDLPRISTDPRLISRAVDELLANAVVYTNPGGRVTVRARLDEETADCDLLCLSVQDNGQGMTKAELDNVFEPFERGSHPRLSLSGAGAGLGLALAKGCAKKLGGDIEVESKHGKGSTFTIRVPVELVD